MLHNKNNFSSSNNSSRNYVRSNHISSNDFSSNHFSKNNNKYSNKNISNLLEFYFKTNSVPSLKDRKIGIESRPIDFFVVIVCFIRGSKSFFSDIYIHAYRFINI
ncbi:hypothetical protein EDEG_03594 [Edhazardia aedis USNM 41457]|uniref:Uncharacterized protein n=1 Tax=Edhazardia aedis (strain USNM 41457) TaxID=1003232 RepID=J9DKM0_EDHAE|nr:hypothetical protein EDEG_03594 [Edhazardia aedis USNM 41457]|eukprot:EJW01937.1 hypothetical protein EDEG_03594 [Edhazardia aedis USNM 41457]